MDQRDALEKKLQRGVQVLSLDIDTPTQLRLLDYLELIRKWNKAYNLTAIREPMAMLDLHLLDSLAIVSKVEELKIGNRLIDVGTGAGLPGVVLAIINPNLDVSLLDTNGKKCRFLNQVKIELGLKNIQVIHDRVEKFNPEQGFDVVLSRAFATLKDMTDNAAHLLLDGGRFLAMKGRYPKEELDELNQQFSCENAYSLQIPGLEVERYLIDIAVKNK